MTKAEDHFRKVAPHYMRKLMGDFPLLSKLDAAAIFGNLGHESKGLTDDQEDAPTVKGSRGGLNWAQWTGPRRRAMEAYCKRNGFDPTSDEAAYKWLFNELKGAEKRALPATMKAVSLGGKVEAFERSFLRAGIKHYESRKKWAVIALDALEKAPVAPIPRPREVPVPPPPDIEPIDPKPQRRTLENFFDRLFKRTPKTATPTLKRKSTMQSWFSGIVFTTALKYAVAIVASYLAAKFGLDEGNVTAIIMQLVGVLMGVWGMSSAAQNKVVNEGKVVQIADLPPAAKADVKAAVANAN